MELAQTVSTLDYLEEQDKATFMEFLYQEYKPENHCFTGLWEQFKLDSALLVKEQILIELEKESL
tara:strand:+ start:1578 stop:1772 length:195 start_codon:yes stop_codon:yes gene_type:complete